MRLIKFILKLLGFLKNPEMTDHTIVPLPEEPQPEPKVKKPGRMLPFFIFKSKTFRAANKRELKRLRMEMKRAGTYYQPEFEREFGVIQ